MKGIGGQISTVGHLGPSSLHVVDLAIGQVKPLRNVTLEDIERLGQQR